MHPILARAERLAAYLTAWLVVALLLGAVLTRQETPWVAALLLLLPICLVYAFVCLSAWYVCAGHAADDEQRSARAGARRRWRPSSQAACGSVWRGRGCRRWPPRRPPAPRSISTAGMSRCSSPSGVLLFLLALTVHYAAAGVRGSRARPSGVSSSSRCSRATRSCERCGRSSIRTFCTTASTRSAR